MHEIPVPFTPPIPGLGAVGAQLQNGRRTGAHFPGGEFILPQQAFRAGEFHAGNQRQVIGGKHLEHQDEIIIHGRSGPVILIRGPIFAAIHPHAAEKHVVPAIPHVPDLVFERAVPVAQKTMMFVPALPIYLFKGVAIRPGVKRFHAQGGALGLRAEQTTRLGVGQGHGRQILHLVNPNGCHGRTFASISDIDYFHRKIRHLRIDHELRALHFAGQRVKRAAGADAYIRARPVAGNIHFFHHPCGKLHFAVIRIIHHHQVRLPGIFDRDGIGKPVGKCAAGFTVAQAVGFANAAGRFRRRFGGLGDGQIHDPRVIYEWMRIIRIAAIYFIHQKLPGFRFNSVPGHRTLRNSADHRQFLNAGIQDCAAFQGGNCQVIHAGQFRLELELIMPIFIIMP